MKFTERLESRVRTAGTLLCVGLDPHPADLEEPTGAAAQSFCLRLIESCAEHAAAFKPNAAFFEALGPSGWEALAAVIRAVPDEIPVILDAKRGDIASTAEAYARSVFEQLGAAAVTLGPYLGRDALEPFLRSPEKGVFLLCRTTNPGAAEVQELTVVRGGLRRPLYLEIASKARSWNDQGNIGLVVGATDFGGLREVRELFPEAWILAPGVGAQGANLAAALDGGLRPDGGGLLIAASRSIARAESPGDAARELKELIEERRPYIAHIQDRRQQERVTLAMLADALVELGCVRFGEFTLKSGLISPFYLDLRRLVGAPFVLEQVAEAYARKLEPIEFDHLAALPYAALPIGTAISLLTGRSLVYPRKETKEYGTRAAVEGLFESDQTVVLIDDLATTGGSKFEAVEKLAAAGLVARDVVVLIDRESGAREALAEKGLSLHSVFTLRELLRFWQRSGRVPAESLDKVWRFLESQRPPA